TDLRVLGEDHGAECERGREHGRVAGDAGFVSRRICPGFGRNSDSSRRRLLDAGRTSRSVTGGARGDGRESSGGRDLRGDTGTRALRPARGPLHTSNGREFMGQFVKSYRGAEFYRPSLAVRDRRVITANGLATFAFPRKSFTNSLPDGEDDIAIYEKLYARGGLDEPRREREQLGKAIFPAAARTAPRTGSS